MGWQQYPQHQYRVEVLEELERNGYVAVDKVAVDGLHENGQSPQEAATIIMAAPNRAQVAWTQAEYEATLAAEAAAYAARGGRQNGA